MLWYDGLGMSLFTQTAGARPLRLAVASRWRCGDLGLATGLHARRHRLAQSTAHLEAPRAARLSGGTPTGADVLKFRRVTKQTPIFLPDNIEALKAALLAEQ